jgi:hypothetical protein
MKWRPADQTTTDSNGYFAFDVIAEHYRRDKPSWMEFAQKTWMKQQTVM